ncbi:UNVERIFIED_ORG: MinD-like ATPase involved in chromosome partitioning or flagellar assembly [Anoxybacillus amylolyticus]
MKRILLASGQPDIDRAVQSFLDYETVGVVEYKKDVYEAVQFYNPDILLVGEGLSGKESLTEILFRLVKDFPSLRIVYLAGFVDLRDEARIQKLGLLVMAGIYDIVHEKKVTIYSLKHLLDHPRTLEQMEYLTKKVKDSSPHGAVVEFEIPEEPLEEEEGVYSNVYVVSSIKPGTGKSFLSVNIATAIAAFGVDKQGRRPKVALVEADLQNLSIGTLLQIEDDKKNLKAALDRISLVVSPQGKMTGSTAEIEEVNEFIRSCFQPYFKVKNLEALVGSQLTFDQLKDIKAHHYVYLIDAVSKEYDVVIVDTNSSLAHVTTYPLLHMAKSCYYVLNLDFNNIRNNVRYRDLLKEMGVLHKVRYVLNEDIPHDMEEAGQGVEPLIFTAEHLHDSPFKLEARIPLLPKTVFLNRLYEGTPIVLDEQPYTLKARYELFKIANQIYPIRHLSKMEEQLNGASRHKKKRSRFF